MTRDLNLEALSAADGFLSGLLFLDVTGLGVTQRPNTNLLVPSPQSLESWKRMGDIRDILHGYWSQVMNVLPTLGAININDTLASLTNPTTFCEAAVLSFRNTLTGRPPHTLGDILALCILSYATSSYLSNEGSLPTNESPCIDQWRDAISDHDHRQAFTYIMEALYPGTANQTPILGSLRQVAEYSEPFGFTYQDAPYGMSPHQDNFSEDDFLKYLANYGNDLMPDYFAVLGAESTNQLVQRHCADSYRTRPTGAERPSLRDLQGSAVITQLKHFLEGCGELPQILSSRGATTKYSNCPVNQLTPRGDDGVQSCIQRMRQTEFSLDATFSAIISVVDRFIQLGYLRTTEDVQEYMLIVGKVKNCNKPKRIAVAELTFTGAGGYARQALCEVLPIGSEYPRDDFTRYAKRRPSTAHHRVRPVRRSTNP